MPCFLRRLHKLFRLNHKLSYFSPPRKHYDMKKTLQVLVLALLTTTAGFAQEGKTAEVPPSKKFRFNPSLGVGVGILKYYGDIEDVTKTSVHRIGNRFGANATLGLNFSNSFYVNIDVLKAKVAGNENTSKWNRNFESDVFGIGASIMYNFNAFYRKKPRPLRPFIALGISYTDYDVKTDLYDKDGNLYYYWSDGLIRNEPESSNPTDALDFLDRDFEYETSLRSKPVVAMAVPATLGIDLHVGGHISFRLAATYYYTFTDLIDNFDNPSYSEYNDRFLYTSMSVHYHFLYDKKEKQEGAMQEVYFADFKSIEQEDGDGDGVKDWFDKCQQTPKNTKVDEFGCPLDSDHDGIPDHLDSEPKTPRGRLVDEKGVAINFQKLAEQQEKAGADTIALLRRSVTETYINSQPREGFKYTVHVGTFGKDIPPPLHKKLTSLPGIIEKKINDTLTIFTLGSYENFDEAEKKQNQLIEEGIEESFAVADDVVEQIAPELEEVEVANRKPQGSVRSSVIIDTKQKEKEVEFKVQITEYRMRIELEKLSQVMAEHGVEMRTSQGGLKIFTIGSFPDLKSAEALKTRILKLGIKEAEVVASYNNRGISIEKAQEILEGK